MSKTCSAFGHRDIYETEKLEPTLQEAVADAIQRGCTEFLTGNMGAFDSLFSRTVREAKKEHPNIKLVCVKPYFTKELEEDKEYYYNYFDEIVIPEVCAGSPPQYAIPKRNQWMVEQSDLILFYVFKHYGGAYNAKEYAQQRHKDIIELSTTLPDLQKSSHSDERKMARQSGGYGGLCTKRKTQKMA